MNTTIADNHAISSCGGGLFVDGNAPVTLTHVTLTGNEAAGSGGIDGALDGVRIRSPVIAQNRGTVAAPNCNQDGAESLGGNVGAPGCGFGLPSDVAVADPLLGALGGDLPAASRWRGARRSMSPPRRRARPRTSGGSRVSRAPGVTPARPSARSRPPLRRPRPRSSSRSPDRR